MSEFTIETVTTLSREEAVIPPFATTMNPGDSCITKLLELFGLNLADPSTQQLLGAMLANTPAPGSFEEKIKNFITRQVPSTQLPENHFFQFTVSMRFDIVKILPQQAAPEAPPAPQPDPNLDPNPQ